MNDSEILDDVCRLVEVYSGIGMPCEVRFKQVYDLIVGRRAEREAAEWCGVVKAKSKHKVHKEVR